MLKDEAPLRPNVVSVLAAEILLILADSILPVELSSVIATSAPAVDPANSIAMLSDVPATAPAFKLTVRAPAPFVIPTLPGITATSLTVKALPPSETALIESNVEAVFARFTTTSPVGVTLRVSIFSTFGVNVPAALVTDKISEPAPPSKVSTSFSSPVVEKSNESAPDAPTKLSTPVVPLKV